MDNQFGYVPITNSKVLCVGGISPSEAEAAREAGKELDGRGFYIFLADEAEPAAPIEVLAKFASESDAHRVLRLMAAREA